MQKKLIYFLRFPIQSVRTLEKSFRKLLDGEELPGLLKEATVKDAVNLSIVHLKYRSILIHRARKKSPPLPRAAMQCMSNASRQIGSLMAVQSVKIPCDLAQL